MPITKSKFSSLLFAAAFVSFATTSCKKTDVAAPVEENSAAQIEELRQFIITTTGEDNVTYSASAKDFVIANDANMSVADAKAYLAKSKSGQIEAGNASTEGIQHRRSYYAVAPTKAVAIKIYANSTVPAVWMAALDQAIANWNASGSLLSITRVSAPGTNVMNVTGINNGGTGVIATTYYPDYNSNVGKSCTINTYYNYLSAGQQIFAMTHELGHAFGFGHTNSTYGTLVPGSPNTDGNSIMNSVCLNWSAFTAYDLAAIRTVYPK
ncbi:MAG: hypothetical protein JWP27_355 [Flaviaesturariibacter sp.]|nr:hypothetical protein [Flaviaesturariibacter sp.]